MAHIQNLEQNEEVPEGTFNWELNDFLESKRTIESPLFKFGRSKSFFTLGREAVILNPSFGPCRIIFLTMEVPHGFSVFSQVTFYKMCLIDPRGYKFYSGKGTIFQNDKCIIPMCLRQAELIKKLFPEDRTTVCLSWYSWNKSSLHEVGTQTTYDLISEEPGPILLQKLSDDFQFFYDRKSDTDCVLRVGNLQFPAHQAVLAARSTVFAAMFHHETSEKLSGMVNIQDVEDAVVGDVLKYMYTGRIHGLNSETAAAMYVFSDKYAIFELRDHCLCFLKNNMTVENVSDAAVLARTHGETELEEKVLKFIEDRLEDMQQSTAWKHFVNANPLIAVKYLTSSFIAYKKNRKDEQK